MCDKLEDLGYIERVRTKEDRRVVNIVLTGSGKQHILSLFDTFALTDLDKISAVLQRIDELVGGMLE